MSFVYSGEVVPFCSDDVFSEKHLELSKLLSQQMAEYEREEHTLRVLMMEEVREKMSNRQIQGLIF